MPFHRSFGSKNNVAFSQVMLMEFFRLGFVEIFQVILSYVTEPNIANIDDRDTFLDVLACFELRTEGTGLQACLATIPRRRLAECRRSS